MASTPGSAPKSMSSRLLTMKFMQRAAASSPNVRTPSTPEEPSPKRRKKDWDAESPSTKFDVNALANQSAIQAAIATEEAKKEAALERAALESGDTRWVLSFEDQQAPSPSLVLRVVETGYANLDAPSNFKSLEVDMEEDKPMMVGRRSFGKFNKKLEKTQGEDDSESSSEEDEDEESGEESDDDDNDPAAQMIRASRLEVVARAKEERKKKKREEKAESEKLAKKRKKTTINLNGLTSLSGRAAPASSIKCYQCGGPHHKKDCPQVNAPAAGEGCFNCGGPHFKRDCPQPGKRNYQGGDDGPPRKAIKSR